VVALTPKDKKDNNKKRVTARDYPYKEEHVC